MRFNTVEEPPWYPATRNVAIVSGAYSLVVAALLVANFFANSPGPPGEGPLYSAELAEQMTLLNQGPRSEELERDIRSLDLEVRRDYFQRKALSQRGKYLLLAGVIVFVLALKKAVTIRETPPMPVPKYEGPELETQRLKVARGAVGIVSLSILGGVLALISMPSIDLESPPSTPDLSSPPKADFPSREEIDMNWPMFRGPGGLGISAYERVPVSWDEESGRGILWKTEIPLPGHNSPIVWNDRLFISGADDQKKEVYGYSTTSGKLLWQSPVENVPGNTGEIPEVYADTGYAASTMACDGKRVYAIFVDGDLVCLDLDGKTVWSKNLGMPDSIYSFATSLVVYRDLLLIQYDQGDVGDGLSVLYALECKTGRIVWRTARPVGGSWTSPILIDTGDEEQLITCSDPWIIAYNPATGQELWRADLLGMDLAPSPIFAGGMVFVIKPNEMLVALRVDGRGDVTKTHVVWSDDFPAPDICSPVSDGELIFLLGTAGTLSCFEVEDGTLCWEHELDDMFQASPSLANGWVYLVSEKGVTYRVKAAKTFEEAGTSRLDDLFTASPAFMDGRIFIRGDLSLYCIGND